MNLDQFGEAYVTRANLYSKIGDMNRCIEDYKEVCKVPSHYNIRTILMPALFVRR